ncbi:hypothetical protein [Anaerobacillus alkalilacustris]|uniref:hypothetical protein n=1 Tax=Anaerobacillus alkalilacustris TaxID=393763 RepID=UPI0011133DB5|nr:hypothetical protein [Anaerobacillus alkalilacustris]
MSTPEEHAYLQEVFPLDNFEFLTDYQGEFGQKFGFLDLDGNQVVGYERGYVGVNPETENMVVEIDYLIGEKIKEVLKKMEEL